MTAFRRPILSFLTLIFLPAVTLACLWDYDTLLQERSRFPDSLELITGKFLRHSREFYEWRIADRLAKLKADPDNLAYLDDLAVAYDKTGGTDRAIEITREALKKKPGRYETESNLGTFYFHAGQWAKGLEHVNNAIRINPDAHFGREKYQVWLVEYILSCQKDGKTPLPLRGIKLEAADTENLGFGKFLAVKLGGEPRKWLGNIERQEAMRGVSGMMRFGHHESPILLEVLADLLSRGFLDSHHEDAKRLAARSYLKASYVVPEDAAKQQYRKLAAVVLHEQTRHPSTLDTLELAELETDFKAELAEAEEWFRQVRADEMRWIQEGKDVDQEYARKYYQEPTVATRSGEYFQILLSNWDILLVGVVIVVAVLFALKRRRGSLAQKAAR